MSRPILLHANMHFLVLLLSLIATDNLAHADCGRPSWPLGAVIDVHGPASPNNSEYPEQTVVIVSCNEGTIFQVAYVLVCENQVWNVTSTPPDITYKSCGE